MIFQVYQIYQEILFYALIFQFLLTEILSAYMIIGQQTHTAVFLCGNTSTSKRGQREQQESDYCMYMAMWYFRHTTSFLDTCNRKGASVP